MVAPDVADIATDAGFEVAGFVENLDRDRCDTDIGGLPVHWVEDLGALAGDHVAVCGLGTTHRSRFVDEVAPFGITFATVVHPAAHVSRGATLAEGCVVGPGAVVATGARLGRHVLLNRNASVGHHTVIGDYCSIQAGADVAGTCVVGEATWVSIGATVVDQLTVGSHSIVGAGAVVTRDVPDRVTVVGVPAKIIKEGIEGR